MTKDDIKRYQFARPFKSFSLHLSDGRSFRIDHPEFLMHSPRSQSILLADMEDKWRLIDLRHVMSVEADQPPDDEKTRDKLGLDDQE
jgi:hypothetical protein